jgi:hypothetical protein
LTARSRELREVAERIAAAFPPVVEEVVLTGSVSRGVADELSDIEMLVVTTEPLGLAECFEHAGAAGLESLDSWGPQGTETSRVFGYFEHIPVELIWWSREFAEASVAGLIAADALANGIALRTAGALAAWQDRLRVYPEELAAARIEEAAESWGGFHSTGFLTLARPGERLALNRVWQPTSKRLADRVEALPVKPDRLAERIEQALTEPEPLQAMLVMCELQIDTLALAPSGANADRARRWLPEVADVLRGAR